MAEATIVSESPKTRLDLATILKVHGYDINQAADEVVRILNLEEDKIHSAYSLMSKVLFNFRKSKKSIESLDGEWWSASIPWIPVKPKSTQSFISVSGCEVESGVILVPNVERRKSIDNIQVRSKKIRFDQTGILTSIRVYISYSSHVISLFDLLLKECVLNLPVPHFYPLTLKLKHGLDGSGSHSSPGLLSALNIDRSSYIVFMVSPIQVIDRFGNVLWENRHPNSCFSNQPVALICQKETIDTDRIEQVTKP
ncbi:hypothetical protein LOD99_10381 [Oopsacas minuta]|uniref:UBA domain-containing protein n=1 Tax=Oopsacas minuta TaxID=111878 RepID=A0AAV7KK50_9METZ|nr:hypothetical protein LOD99_10381 [Oopsacas minuta]